MTETPLGPGALDSLRAGTATAAVYARSTDTLTFLGLPPAFIYG